MCESKSSEEKIIAEVLFDARKDFIVLGLCGQTGSGVSTVAEILTTPFEELKLPVPSDAGHGRISESEYRILYRFGEKNFEKFVRIKTSSLITATILEHSEDNFVEYLKGKFDVSDEKGVKEIVKGFFEKTMTWYRKDSTENIIEIIESALTNEEKESLGCKVSLEENGDVKIPFIMLQKLFQTYLQKRKSKGQYNDKLVYKILHKYIFEELPKASKELWGKIDEIKESFLSTIILQNMGHNIRMTKTPYDLHAYNGDEATENNEKAIDPTAFQEIAYRINTAIKLLRDYVSFQDTKEKTVVVIDSIKNPFESMYLKDRYSNYYLVAIYTENQERRERLEKNRKLDRETIKLIDTVEQFSQLKKELEENRKNSKEKETADGDGNVESDKNLGNKNKSKKETKTERALKGLKTIPEYNLQFIVQNVEACIQSADIFINNPPSDNQYIELKKTLLRYVSLIMYPGLVLPTNIERCMQIAFAAKANSGCISRQVGAVITDSEYHLCSIGWNQVPEGQTPCIYRNLVELYRHWNTDAYSSFENDDDEDIQKLIGKSVKEFYETEKCKLSEVGREAAFCFKDIYKKKEQVYARSLHAEETAFLNLTGDNKRMAEGGYLFTTSSPCVSCAKKAVYIGISKIYYIEPYPGITFNHILAMGAEEKRIESILFTGAIGRAYTQLYTPLFPKKDELELWLGHKLNHNDIENEKWKKEKGSDIETEKR